MFAEFFSELDGGGASKAEILGDGPLFRASRSHLASRSIMMRQRAAAISQCRCTPICISTPYNPARHFNKSCNVCSAAC
ncbi:MAG: hypothetical protein ACU85U_04790, partial [Gammaproteobacteria bacterium]